MKHVESTVTYDPLAEASHASHVKDSLFAGVPAQRFNKEFKASSDDEHVAFTCSVVSTTPCHVPRASWIAQPFICKPPRFVSEVQSLKTQCNSKTLVPTLLQPQKKSSASDNTHDIFLPFFFFPKSSLPVPDVSHEDQCSTRCSESPNSSHSDVNNERTDDDPMRVIHSSLEQLMRQLLSDADASTPTLEAQQGHSPVKEVKNTLQSRYTPHNSPSDMSTAAADNLCELCHDDDETAATGTNAGVHADASIPPCTTTCIWNPLQFPGSQAHNGTRRGREAVRVTSRQQPVCESCNMKDYQKSLRRSNQHETSPISTLSHLSDIFNSICGASHPSEPQEQNHKSLYETHDALSPCDVWSRKDSSACSVTEEIRGLAEADEDTPTTPGTTSNVDTESDTSSQRPKRIRLSMTSPMLHPQEVSPDGDFKKLRYTSVDKTRFQHRNDYNAVSPGRYSFDAKLNSRKETKNLPGSGRFSAEYSCSYPGVSWNTRMQSWLVYFEDATGRKSRTFNPKRLSETQLNSLPAYLRQKTTTDPIEVSMHCACVFASRVRWEQRRRKTWVSQYRFIENIARRLREFFEPESKQMYYPLGYKVESGLETCNFKNFLETAHPSQGNTLHDAFL